MLKLHLGVNSASIKFAIEQQAVNEATFRCPDELGWQPQVNIHKYTSPLNLLFNCHFGKILILYAAIAYSPC